MRTSSHSLVSVRPSPLQRGQGLRLFAPRPSHSRHGREKIMWPRLPRTLPEPPQRGHGTGAKVTSPPPPQPAQASKRTSWTRRRGAQHRLLEAHARRLLDVLAARGRGLGQRVLEDLAEADRLDAHARLEVEALEAALGRGRHGLRRAARRGRRRRGAAGRRGSRTRAPPPDSARRPPDRPGSPPGGARATASARHAGSRRRPRPASRPAARRGPWRYFLSTTSASITSPSPFFGPASGSPGAAAPGAGPAFW